MKKFIIFTILFAISYFVLLVVKLIVGFEATAFMGFALIIAYVLSEN